MNWMSLYIYVSGFVIGACIGSFLGCALYRVPRGISLVGRRSHCASCGHVLTPTELVPVFSYVCQGGRARCCHMKLAPYYAIAEFFCGLAGAAVAWWIFSA